MRHQDCNKQNQRIRGWSVELKRTRDQVCFDFDKNVIGVGTKLLVFRIEESGQGFLQRNLS